MNNIYMGRAMRTPASLVDDAMAHPMGRPKGHLNGPPMERPMGGHLFPWGVPWHEQSLPW